MRLALIAFLGSVVAAPVVAGDRTAATLFGRDPGSNAAYACFSKAFDAAWLTGHPEQNVARLTVFVARRTGEDSVWHTGNMEIHFRDSAATYHVTADCSGADGALGCGVDCDGGGYRMSVISKSDLGIKVDDYLRYYDISDAPSGEKTSGFKSGDKDLVVQRTNLQDCLPLVGDDEVKAKIANGALTQ